MPELALYDLVSPYVLKGDTFGQWHAALSVIYVAEHTITVDDGGIVIRGVARFSGDVHPFIDPDKMTFGVDAENTTGHPSNDPARRNPWIDVRDAQIDFELSAPRETSQKIAGAVAALGANAGFAATAAVLKAYDANTADAPPSDYGSTNFTIDLLLTTIVLRPPFLVGAKLDQASGILLEDPNNKQVKFTLPKIKVRLSQGSGVNDPLQATLLSLGASGLDDRDDIGVAQLITMDPPYAFVGPSKIVGFGFRSATLDLSDGSTPPDVLSQFGYDDSWTGLYLPELRLYIAPHGAHDLAFDASATNLLIGFGASAGVTGDFELAIVDQGSGDVHVGARFYDADNRAYAITKTSDTTATVLLPAKTRLVVDIDGGLTPYIASAKIGTAADVPGRLFPVDFGVNTSLTIVLTAKGSQPGATPVKLTITATKKGTPAALPSGTITSSATPGAVVTTTGVKQGGNTVAIPQLKLISQSSTQATIALDTDATTAAQTHWTVAGADKGISAVITVDCAEGGSVDVKAELPGQTGVAEFTGYYHFDHPSPPPHPEDASSYTVPADNTHTAPAIDPGPTAGWVGGSDIQSALFPILDTLPAGTPITIEGYSSFESGDNPDPTSNDFQYNKKLANNRAVGLKAIIQRYTAKTFTYPSTADNMTAWGPLQGDPTRNVWWKAVAKWPPTNPPGTVTTGTVTRAKSNPVTPPPPPDNPDNAPVPETPSWFKKIDVKVRIVRNHFVACEVSGKFDIQTPTENQLASGGVANADIPKWGKMGSQNPGDGIVEASIVVQIDDAKDTVTVTGSFGADPADLDGLLKMGWVNPPPATLPAPNYGLNFLGLGVAFWPLIADAASLTSNNGSPVELAVTGVGLGVVAAMAGLYKLEKSVYLLVERVVWYGGEFEVQVRPDGDEVLVLVDIETAISANVSLGPVKILTIDRKSPLVVRYKAIGFIIGNKPGESKFPFRPYFDSSKGYSIDVSKPGTIKVGDPFDKILKILGARMARNNPFMIEVDLGFSLDLGVISIDRARVRMHLDPVGVELTAFTAGVDIPGALRGTGSIEMGSDAEGNTVLSGALDVTIVPVDVRIAATLQIAQISAANGGPATAVKVTLEVDFPVAIPLGTSGIGIYGFLGLFAVNFERDESKIQNTDQPAMAPALAWLRATGGDPSNIDYWKPKINHWAFGVGAVLGTEGSSFILNLKGIFLLELPGPRLLLMMKANLIKVAPPTKGSAEGVFLAVLDLDFGRGTLTIGLSIDFSIDEQIPILKLKIPVEAFFNFNDTSDWHLYLGTYSNMIQAVVLGVFDASGYLMLSGNGIAAHPAGISGNTLPAVTGFSIGAGLHVSFKWGGSEVYAELAAGFDAVIGFSPFRAAGVMSVRGSLHLFILDISAWAELAVDIGDDGQGGHICQITGEICGKVELLFFSVSGCVSFTLGGDSVPVPAAPPLVKSLKLVSRSPALVAGTGAGKKIDCSLADAVEGEGGQPAGDLPVMPLDILPAIMMAVPPLQDPALKFTGPSFSGAIGGTPHAPYDGWVQRGDMWYRYTITKVELSGPVTAGATPAVWWNSKAGDQALEAQLALLSWKPDATPTAVGSSKYLDQTTKEKWGTTCDPVAPATPVLWTFFFQVLGPSATGWNPYGLAQPDPPNSIRSSPVDLHMHVSERWRCGDSSIDNMRGIIPAAIEGAAVPCLGKTTGGLVGTPTLGTTHPVLAPHPIIAPLPVITTRPTVPVNPIVALRGSARQSVESTPAMSLAEILRKSAGGEAISRASLSSATLSSATLAGLRDNAVAAPAPKCFGWALASPLFDDGRVVAFGDPSIGDHIKEGWKARKFQPGPLDDAVVFNFGGPFEYARFFLWIPERFISNVVVVATSDAKDTLFTTHIIQPADHVPPTVLPATWIGPSSPWFTATTVLAELVAVAAKSGYVPVFVTIKGSPGADRVQIGCTQESRRIRNAITLRPFYTGGIEVLKSAELARANYDTKEQKKKQGVLNDAFGLDSTANALLQADTTYSVNITWTSDSQQRKQGEPPSSVTTKMDQVQSFWFKTDANPPAKLDPWILMSLPADAEKHYFAAEHVKVVFGTNNVAQLYDAYHKRLQARLRPSSYVPVPSTASVPHPLPLSSAFLKGVKATVLPPWDNAVQKLVSVGLTGKDINGKPPALPCVASNGDRETHSMVTIPIVLDLFTDYVVDIEMVDKAAPEGTAGTLLWRSSFSTGAFLNETDFANSFQISKINHRGVMADNYGKLQAIGVSFAGTDPEGGEFDAALIGAGLESLPVPKYPSFTIFWESAGPAPQPVAILVDSSEPMWRERPIPTEITDPGPAASQWYELASQPWLELAEGPAPITSIVDQIVYAPGAQRALVTLHANARGELLKLALVRLAHVEPYLDGPGATNKSFPILNMKLTAAPWEEVD